MIFSVYNRTVEARNFLLRNIPEKFTAFHWHGDTSSLPKGAKQLLVSEASKNQRFSYKNRVLLVAVSSGDE